jgi:hypothetical protein
MLKNVSMKMRELDIPAFVQAVVDTGCDICAVGHLGYTIGDVDLPLDKREAVALKLREIHEKFWRPRPPVARDCRALAVPRPLHRNLYTLSFNFGLFCRRLPGPAIRNFH